MPLCALTCCSLGYGLFQSYAVKTVPLYLTLSITKHPS
uniref:Uncharacterized protein n=1 Tax=Anguilla anguilla TaxID=7936 RepID=A0A0E9Q9U3_ANGAN